MELLETIARRKMEHEDITVHCITAPEQDGSKEQQESFLAKIQENVGPIGIIFSWKFDEQAHARHIITDHGWEILLDRGLDIFQPYSMNDSFDPANRVQKYRSCKKFEITYRQQN